MLEVSVFIKQESWSFFDKEWSVPDQDVFQILSKNLEKPETFFSFIQMACNELTDNGGEMGENNLGDALFFSCIFNNMLWYFWGFNYSQMAN